MIGAEPCRPQERGPGRSDRELPGYRGSCKFFPPPKRGFSYHFTAEGWCPFKNRNSSDSMEVGVILRGSIDLVGASRSSSSFSSAALFSLRDRRLFSKNSHAQASPNASKNSRSRRGASIVLSLESEQVPIAFAVVEGGGGPGGRVAISVGRPEIPVGTGQPVLTEAPGQMNEGLVEGYSPRVSSFCLRGGVADL